MLIISKMFASGKKTNSINDIIVQCTACSKTHRVVNKHCYLNILSVPDQDTKSRTKQKKIKSIYNTLKYVSETVSIIKVQDLGRVKITMSI